MNYERLAILDLGERNCMLVDLVMNICLQEYQQRHTEENIFL